MPPSPEHRARLERIAAELSPWLDAEWRARIPAAIEEWNGSEHGMGLVAGWTLEMAEAAEAADLGGANQIGKQQRMFSCLFSQMLHDSRSVMFVEMQRRTWDMAGCATPEEWRLSLV